MKTTFVGAVLSLRTRQAYAVLVGTLGAPLWINRLNWRHRTTGANGYHRLNGSNGR